MSVPPPSWQPNSTSTGSASLSDRSTTAVSNATSDVFTARIEASDGAEYGGIDDRLGHRAGLVDRDDHLGGQPARAARVAHQALRHDRAVLRQIVIEIAADRGAEIDVGPVAAAASGWPG